MSRARIRGVQLLPAAPFSEWLATQDFVDRDLEHLTGVAARVISRLRNGEQDQVSLDTVDRIVTLGLASPELLNELYPLEEAA